MTSSPNWSSDAISMIETRAMKSFSRYLPGLRCSTSRFWVRPTSSQDDFVVVFFNVK